MRAMHPQEDWVKPLKEDRVRPQMKCAQCGAVTTRMDLHLKKQHKLASGTEEYTTLMGKATPYVREPEEDEDLERVLREYR